jgi:hypothetical protein
MPSMRRGRATENTRPLGLDEARIIRCRGIAWFCARPTRFELLPPGFAGQGHTPGSGHKGRTFRRVRFPVAIRAKPKRISTKRHATNPVQEEASWLPTRDLLTPPAHPRSDACRRKARAENRAHARQAPTGSARTARPSAIRPSVRNTFLGQWTCWRDEPDNIPRAGAALSL